MNNRDKINRGPISSDKDIKVLIPPLVIKIIVATIQRETTIIGVLGSNITFV